jgi:hypothetical protein
MRVADRPPPQHGNINLGMVRRNVEVLDGISQQAARALAKLKSVFKESLG